MSVVIFSLNVSFLEIGNDALSLIVNKTDSNTLIRTSTLCKTWFLLSSGEELWKKRSLGELKNKIKPLNLTWREFYIFNTTEHRLIKIEEVGERYVGVFGNKIISFPKSKALTGQIIYDYVKTDHVNIITVCSFSSREYDAMKCLTGGDNINVWTSTNQRHFTKYTTCDGHLGAVTAIQWINEYFISGCSKGSLYLWAPYDNTYLQHSCIIKAHSSAVSIITCSKQGVNSYVFSGGMDGSITVSKLESEYLTTIESVKRHKSIVTALCTINDQDHAYLFSGSATERIISIWKLELKKGKLLKEAFIADAHEHGISEIKYLRGKIQLLSRGKDRKIKLWDKMGFFTQWKCAKIFDLAYSPIFTSIKNNRVQYIAAIRDETIKQEDEKEICMLIDHID